MSVRSDSRRAHCPPVAGRQRRPGADLPRVARSGLGLPSRYVGWRASSSLDNHGQSVALRVPARSARRWVGAAVGSAT
jgi:hypothetical protein